LNLRHYSGGIQVEHMGDTGIDNMSLEGMGQFIEGTCTGGTVVIRGNFTVSGITNLTLSDDARYDVAQINAECDTALSDADIATATLQTTIAGYLDTEITTIISNLGIVDTIVDAIKAKTDQLTFTKALELDTNSQSINGSTVVGDGKVTPWEGT
jgi:hypothetical protein